MQYNTTMILGIDEAGRGPWAGPLVVGAVVLGGAEIMGLNDSKKLNKKVREALEVEIHEKASAWALGWVSAKELDDIGMSEALRLATRRAVEQIHVPYHEIIIDGTVNFLKGTAKGEYVTALPKADALIPSVSAASVIAKVARDRYMADLDDAYLGYGFAKHAGYGVVAHRAAIERLCVTPEHRLSFAPLQKYGYKPKATQGKQKIITTRQIGNASEDAAANELIRLGHTIIERNWKTKYCEIDIVSRKRDTIYFTEVKHRKNDKAGDGLAAITPKKLRQMEFAMKLYVHNNGITNTDLQLMAIATVGSVPNIVSIIEIKD